MNLNQYTVTGDPQELLATWNRTVAAVGKDAFFLSIVTTSDNGIIILDVCPTEADFQGWINGEDWARIKADLGGDVVITRLGEITSAFARDTVVEVVHAHAHSH
jgi:hypothetical protein